MAEVDAKMQKKRFSGKLSRLVSYNWVFQRNHYWILKIQDDRDPPSWKFTWRNFFCWACPIWIKFWWLVKNAVNCD